MTQWKTTAQIYFGHCFLWNPMILQECANCGDPIILYLFTVVPLFLCSDWQGHLAWGKISKWEQRWISLLRKAKSSCFYIINWNSFCHASLRLQLEFKDCRMNRTPKLIQLQRKCKQCPKQPTSLYTKKLWSSGSTIHSQSLTSACYRPGGGGGSYFPLHCLSSFLVAFPSNAGKEMSPKN